MNDNQRSHEASSLRAFFDDQLQHLHVLVENMVGYAHHEQAAVDEDLQIVQSFVDAANNKVRAVNGFVEKLRIHVRALYDHVLAVSEAIPPPVSLSQSAFGTDPLVNALFVNTQEIERLFHCNPEIRDFLQAHDQSQVPKMYGLLTACKRENSILGVGMQGDMLVRDVPQKSVNFSAHKIHIPCACSTELSKALKRYLFNHVVTLIKQDISLRMADQVYDLGNRSYESRIKSLANPEVYLDTLIGHIENPAKLLSIDKKHYRLSKLGIKLEKGDMQLANEFDIHELTWSDGSRNVMLQISYTW